MLLNEDIVDIEKPDVICSLTFVVDELSGLFLHPSIFSIIHARSGALSDFHYLLNSNTLVYSKGIIMLQKPLFSYTFLCDSSLFFVLNEER